MRMVDTSELISAFRSVGLTDGQVVMVHSDLSRIGWIVGAKTRIAVIQAYWEAIFSIIGKCGTLVTLACTESVGRKHIPYDHLHSPSEQGVFSEFIREMPGSVRSVHPLFSLVSIGRDANTICGNDISPTGFGHGSSFHMLRELDARILCVGVDLSAMTFVHHVEQSYGVPYGYTKEWEVPILYDGKPIDRRYFAFVRYLNSGIEYDFSRLQDMLLKKKLAQVSRLGLSRIWSVRANDVFKVGIEQLKLDPFFFLFSHPQSEPWKL